MLPILLYSCLAPSLTPFSYSYPLVTIDHFSTCVILSFWECYISEITQNIPFWDWLCSRSLIPLRSIQMVACLSSFFSLLPSSIPWYRHTTFCLNIHPLKSIWVIFWLLQIKLLWTFVYVSLLSLCGLFFFFFSVSEVFLEQVDSVLGLLWKEMNKLNGFNLKIDKFLQNTIYQNRYRMKKEDWNNPFTSYLLSHNKSILKFSGLTQKHYFTVSVGQESARDLE